jgi:cell wall-associated NlpC family hydrolase
MPPRLRLRALLLLAVFSFAAAAAAPASAAPRGPSGTDGCLPFGPDDLCPVLLVERSNVRAVKAARAAKAARRKAGPGPRALKAARQYLGVPYAWGGESRGGLDCSGLVVVSFRHVGRKLPHYSGALWSLGRKVPRKALRPGDLVFFRLSGGVPGHVGIYAGKGRYIHAPSSGGRVRYGLMADRADDYAGARRLG